MKPLLKTSALLELTRLFEVSSTFSNDHNQPLFGVPAWYVGKQSTLTVAGLRQWSECVGFTTAYPISIENHNLLVHVSQDFNTGDYCYRCPVTFRKRPVVHDQLAVLNISAQKLMPVLADLFDIPIAERHGIESPAIHNVLWHLGKAQVGNAFIDIWCARHLSMNTEEIFRYFNHQKRPERGIVITLGDALPDIISPPRDYHILALKEILISGCASPQLDKDLLNRLLGNRPKESSGLPSAIHFDSLANTLIIKTKPISPWVMKGTSQVAVVRFLAQQFQNGRQWIPANEILTAVYGHQTQRRSRKIGDIFRGNPLWRDYIATPAKGLYGFRLN